MLCGLENWEGSWTLEAWNQLGRARLNDSAELSHRGTHTHTHCIKLTYTIYTHSTRVFSLVLVLYLLIGSLVPVRPLSASSLVAPVIYPWNATLPRACPNQTYASLQLTCQV